jgi:predicted CoA-binding protein
MAFLNLFCPISFARVLQQGVYSSKLLSDRVKMSTGEGGIAEFFKLPDFVVVGASNDQSKFGNKVLRAYKAKGYKVIPISKRSNMIEEISCLKSLTDFANKFPSKIPQTGVSIITPPGATKLIIEEGASLGYRYFFLQPGTCDAEVNILIERIKQERGAQVIQDCVLVQLGLHDAF